MKEFAVEINNDVGFVKQIDVFSSYTDAKQYIKTGNDCQDDEFYNIICIEYDNNENEIRCYSCSF